MTPPSQLHVLKKLERIIYIYRWNLYWVFCGQSRRNEEIKTWLAYCYFLIVFVSSCELYAYIYCWLRKKFLDCSILLNCKSAIVYIYTRKDYFHHYNKKKNQRQHFLMDCIPEEGCRVIQWKCCSNHISNTKNEFTNLNKSWNGNDFF